MLLLCVAEKPEYILYLILHRRGVFGDVWLLVGPTETLWLYSKGTYMCRQGFSRA